MGATSVDTPAGAPARTYPRHRCTRVRGLQCFRSNIGMTGCEADARVPLVSSHSSSDNRRGLVWCSTGGYLDLFGRALCSVLACSPAARPKTNLGLHRPAVPRRWHRTFEQWVIGLAHPPPEVGAQLLLDWLEARCSCEVALLQPIGIEVIQLPDAFPVPRKPRWIGTKDRAQLDVAWDLDCEARLKVADVLVAVRADAAHRVVVAVKCFFTIDGIARLAGFEERPALHAIGRA